MFVCKFVREKGHNREKYKKLYLTGLRPLMSLTHGTYFDYFPTDFHGVFFSLNLAKKPSILFYEASFIRRKCRAFYWNVVGRFDCIFEENNEKRKRTSTTPSCGGPLRAQIFQNFYNQKREIWRLGPLLPFFKKGPRTHQKRKFSKITISSVLLCHTEATYQKLCFYHQNCGF